MNSFNKIWCKKNFNKILQNIHLSLMIYQGDSHHRQWVFQLSEANSLTKQHPQPPQPPPQKKKKPSFSPHPGLQIQLCKRIAVAFRVDQWKWHNSINHCPTKNKLNCLFIHLFSALLSRMTVMMPSLGHVQKTHYKKLYHMTLQFCK